MVEGGDFLSGPVRSHGWHYKCPLVGFRIKALLCMACAFQHEPAISIGNPNIYLGNLTATGTYSVSGVCFGVPVQQIISRIRRQLVLGVFWLAAAWPVLSPCHGLSV